MGYLFVKPSTSPCSRGSWGIRFGGEAFPTPCFWDILNILSTFPQTKRMPRNLVSIFISDTHTWLQCSHISLASCKGLSAREQGDFCTIFHILSVHLRIFGENGSWWAWHNRDTVQGIRVAVTDQSGLLFHSVPLPHPPFVPFVGFYSYFPQFMIFTPIS